MQLPYPLPAKISTTKFTLGNYSMMFLILYSLIFRFSKVFYDLKPIKKFIIPLAPVAQVRIRLTASFFNLSESILINWAQLYKTHFCASKFSPEKPEKRLILGFNRQFYVIGQSLKLFAVICLLKYKHKQYDVLFPIKCWVRLYKFCKWSCFCKKTLWLTDLVSFWYLLRH